MGELGQSINNNLYRVILSQGLRNAKYEIHGYLFALLFWNEHSLKGSTRLPILIVNLLKIVIVSHKMYNSIFNSLPTVMLSQVFINRSSTSVY